MNFQSFCKTLGIPDNQAENMSVGFEKSFNSFPGVENLETLSDSYLKRVIQICGLDEQTSEVLRSLAETIRKDQTKSLLFFHAIQSLFFGDEQRILCKWPDISHVFNISEAVFYLLVACSVFSYAKKTYQEVGIPKEHMKKIGIKILTTCQLNQSTFGIPGYPRNVIYWLKNYVTLDVVPVGRFEFRHNTAEVYNIAVYKNRHTGKILALSGNEAFGFLADGTCVPADNPDVARISKLQVEQNSVTGEAFDPKSGRGMGLVTLNYDEWESVVSPEDPILEWHIPGGGGMTPDITIQSLKAGLTFFDKYRPALPPAKAIMCSSWAFWHPYEILRPESNPALIMRECYKFERPIAGWSGFYFLFGATTPDELPGGIKDLKVKTSIQRAMLELYKQYGYLGAGGIFVLREELYRWGTSPYRGELQVTDIAKYQN